MSSSFVPYGYWDKDTNPLPIIVHFMRHAEGKHKKPTNSNIRSQLDRIIDPGLTEAGLDQARLFNAGQDTSLITHLLLFPMLRSTTTSIWAFRDFLFRGNNIIALPELQNMDPGPNGTGTDIEILQGQWPAAGTPGCSKIDFWAFMTKDWSWKRNGKWSPNRVQWRMDFLKGFLKGIWLRCGKKRVEIAVVTHGSILRELGVDAQEAQITTCVFNDDGGFRVIDKNRLHDLRCQWTEDSKGDKYVGMDCWGKPIISRGPPFNPFGRHE